MTTLIINVFCEYLVSQSYRIRHSAFSALRLVFSYGLSRRLFTSLDKRSSKPKDDDEADSLILNFDALTITQEIKRTR
jgi:hypothetical protein